MIGSMVVRCVPSGLNRTHIFLSLLFLHVSPCALLFAADVPPDDPAKREAALVYGFGRMCEPPPLPPAPLSTPSIGSGVTAARASPRGKGVDAAPESVSDGGKEQDRSMTLPLSASSMGSEMCERVQANIAKSVLLCALLYEIILVRC
jgi:hypothetical protein